MEPTYSKEELKEKIRRMRDISNRFYGEAAALGVHPFIEFTGFMNEYIKLCESAMEQGIDFTETNTHTGKPLPMHAYEAAYIGEKFDCIFGPSLNSDPALKAAFLASVFGKEEHDE